MAEQHPVQPRAKQGEAVTKGAGTRAQDCPLTRKCTGAYRPPALPHKQEDACVQILPLYVRRLGREAHCSLKPKSAQAGASVLGLTATLNVQEHKQTAM